MIVASPCAVMLSTMPPLLAAIATAGRHGVLVKSAGVMERLGRTQVVAFDKTGTLTLTDQVRDESAGAVAELTRLVDEVVLLTGDNEATARHVSGHVGIGTVHAGLMPQDKSAIVAGLERAGRRVLVVGDGINDAPALASASTGLAMGRRGSDLALDTADGIIVYDDLTAVPRLIRLSRKASRYVIANLVFAACVIATLVTWDLLGELPLPLAVAGHEGSTILVALNGARLLRSSAWTR